MKKIDARLIFGPLKPNRYYELVFDVLGLAGVVEVEKPTRDSNWVRPQASFQPLFITGTTWDDVTIFPIRTPVNLDS